MKELIIIPARKGSKGLPGKNLKVICGKPLIDYTILTALEILEPSLILVSSDCEDIINRGKKFGTNTIIRPNEFATDDSPIIDYFPVYTELDFSYKEWYHECIPKMPSVNLQRF